MRSIEVALNDRSYPVLIGHGILNDPAIWDRFLGSEPVVVISDQVVAPLYLDELATALGNRVRDQVILPEGESGKSLENWSLIIDRLAGCGAGRDSCLLALGGGVIGDLCGFAAATWMRGVDFIQIPTTLLAQVDASVGGKTAINHPAGKNLVGAFHQPRAVIADIGTLATLPDRHYRAGLAEVVKYGAIRDADFLTELERRAVDLLDRDSEEVARVVETSVRCKAEIVARDELETGIRAILNFGHSFAHALETATDYATYLHGEAVAIGMVTAARLSELRGLCATGLAGRLRDLLEALQLPVTIPSGIRSADLLDHMQLDKKNRAGIRRLVLLEGPGRAVLDEASPDALILEAIEACT